MAGGYGVWVGVGGGGVAVRIFISWSGPESHALALILHEWIPMVLPFAKPWMSSENIDKGKRWVPEIGDNLQSSSYCIVCVTPNVAQQPWVNFEAGAVSKIVDSSHVSLVLLGVSIDDLGDVPLKMFQCTIFEKEDVVKLFRSINAASDSAISEQHLSRNLNYTWDEAHKNARRIARHDSFPPQTDRGGNGGPSAELNDAEVDVLTTIANRPEDAMGEYEIADEHGITLVRALHFLTRLVNKGLLVEALTKDEIRYFDLTDQGREYVVDNDLDMDQ